MTSPVLRSLSDEVPADLEAEQAFLGSILVTPEMLDRAAFLSPDDFYLPQHAETYAAMRSLRDNGTPPSIIALRDHLLARPGVDVQQTIEYLVALGNLSATSLYAEHYARIIEKVAMLRRLAEAGTAIAGIGRDRSLTAADAVAQAEERLAAVRRVHQSSSYESKREFLAALAADLTGPYHAERAGVSSGLPPLDSILGGFRRGEMAVLGAPPATGKTSLAVTIARHVALKLHRPVALYSVEMTRESIYEKFLTIETRIPFGHLTSHRLTGHEKALVSAASATLTACPLEVVPAREWTVARLRSESRRLAQLHGTLALIVVDYLQMLVPEARGENHNLAVTGMINGLKAMALELDVPTFVLSSMNRNAAHRTGGEPQMGDLRDSGSIEFAADVILLMWSDAIDQDAPPTPVREVYVKIEKNRLGRTGVFTLGLRGTHMEFVALAGHGEAF